MLVGKRESDSGDWKQGRGQEGGREEEKLHDVTYLHTQEILPAMEGSWHKKK